MLKRSRSIRFDCEILEEHECNGAQEGSDGCPHAADDRNDQNVDGHVDTDQTRRDASVEPDQQDAGRARNSTGVEVGNDAMHEDVDTERAHAPRIVPDRLEPQAESRTGSVPHGEIEEGCDRQGQIVERRGIASVQTEQDGRLDAREPGEAVEYLVVLADEVEEGDRNRQGDHERVDAFGTRSDHAD